LKQSPDFVSKLQYWNASVNQTQAAEEIYSSHIEQITKGLTPLGEIVGN